MNIEKIEITPELATEWLKKNIGNRTPKRERFLYAEMMKRGEWNEDNPQPICFDENGNLIDGQNRLMAVIISDIPVKMYVAKGVSNSVKDVIDTGVKRIGADVLQMQGAENFTRISAYISMYLRVTEGAFTGNTQAVAYPHKIKNEYNSRPQFWQDVHHVTEEYYRKSGGILPPAFIGVYYILFSEKDNDLAPQFFDKVLIGLNLNDQSDPCFKLRQALILNANSVRKLPTKTKAALMVKTWNAFSAGKKIGALKFAEGEKFPSII